MVAMTTAVAWQWDPEICTLRPHISKMQRSINLIIGTSARSPGHVTQFWWIYVKIQGHMVM